MRVSCFVACITWRHSLFFGRGPVFPAEIGAGSNCRGRLSGTCQLSRRRVDLPPKWRLACVAPPCSLLVEQNGLPRNCLLLVFLPFTEGCRCNSVVPATVRVLIGATGLILPMPTDARICVTPTGWRAMYRRQLAEGFALSHHDRLR